MTPCACGCGRYPALGSIYADRERCKQRAYRKRLKEAAAAAGVPTLLNLKTLRQQGGGGARNGDALRRRQAPRKRNPDVRVSYRKAVAALVDVLVDEERARAILEPCLPPRLREAGIATKGQRDA